MIEQERFIKDVKKTSEESTNLLIQKHADYGPSNIMGSPISPMHGLSVRLHDKVARMVNLLNSGNPANFESLRDTMLDISNYGLIGVMVLDNTFASKEQM